MTEALADLGTTIAAVHVGTPRPIVAGGPQSAIRKSPVAGRVRLTRDGVQGDEQADPRFHGGPDRAVLHYAAENYARWRVLFPAQADAFGPALFGENVTSTGVDESMVHIGDRYRLGTALVEVSQPRRPCNKLNLRLDNPKIATSMQQFAMSGWFYRVLEPGELEAGDRLVLLERPADAFSVRQLWRLCSARPPDRAGLQRAVRNAALAPNWSQWIRSRLAEPTADAADAP